jgi:hypothetical protein
MMQTLRLERMAYLDEGTFGKLYLPNGKLFFTVERPWLDNLPRVSCVPEGTYPLIRDYFDRGGYETFQVMDVSGRSQILIHVANWPKDVEGCIGVGLGLDLGNFMVTSSRLAFRAFMESLPGDEERQIQIVSRSAIYV